jgi:hypothetical protein
LIFFTFNFLWLWNQISFIILYLSYHVIMIFHPGIYHSLICLWIHGSWKILLEHQSKGGQLPNELFGLRETTPKIKYFWFFFFFGFEIWRYNPPIRSVFRYTTLISNVPNVAEVVYQFFGSWINKALNLKLFESIDSIAMNKIRWECRTLTSFHGNNSGN